MKERKFFIAFVCTILIALNGNTQYYFYNDKYYGSNVEFEVGASAGIMNALTDLGGKKGVGKGFIKDLNMKNAQLNIGGYAVATYKNAIGLKLEATFGSVKSYDSILKGDGSEAKSRYLRNLSFKTPINEFTAMVEIHPLMFKKYDPSEGNDIPKISPYITGGIGFFSFNPQAKINGTWVNLHPLRTEGQGFAEYPTRKRYQLSQMNIPFGVGIKYELGALFNARFEIIHRKLFTDYLDDVSTNFIDPNLFYNYLNPTQAVLAQSLYNRSLSTDPNFSKDGAIRGDSKDNDSYFTVNVKIGFNLGRQRVK